MAKSEVSIIAAWCMVILVAAHVHETAALACFPENLKSCAPALFNGSPPTELCCTTLKTEQPCLCKYIKDPELAPYIKNPNAKKIAAACGLPFPKCA